MSPFAKMLDEMTERMRAERLQRIELHFDFKPAAEEYVRWACWFFRDDGRPVMGLGRTGEEALRKLVEVACQADSA